MSSTDFNKIFVIGRLRLDKQEISPELMLQMMPELKESYLHNHPFKWKKGSIQLRRVATACIEDCDPSIERYSFLCTPVFFDKKGKHKYFPSYEKTIQEQIAEFDQQLGVIHELDDTYAHKDSNKEVKVKLFQMDSKIEIVNK